MRILTIAIALLLASPASAATDFDQLFNKTKKYMKSEIEDITSKEKGLCVCQDSSVHHGHVGTMGVGTFDSGGSYRVQVQCFVRKHDVTGLFVAYAACKTFFPLAK